MPDPAWPTKDRIIKRLPARWVRWPGPFVASMARGMGVRPGEGRLVSWLLAHSFFNGVAKVLNATAAYTLFLMAFDARSIPYVYIGGALAITTAGYLFIRLDARLPFYPLAAGILLLAAVMDLGFRSLLGAGVGRGAALAFTIWTEVEFILLGLVFWGLAGKLFDIQQGKRLFALVGAGEVVAAMIGGAAVTWLVPAMGTRNLLIISAGGLLASLGVFAHITRRFPSVQPEMRPSSPGEEAPRESMGELIRSQYVLLIFGLIACTYLGYYFLENVFYDRAEAHFTTEASLASFLGLYLGAAGLFTLASRMVVSGRLLRRFGVLAGLLAQPLSVGLLAAGVLFAGLAAGAPAAVFWLVTAATLTDRVLRESISEATRLVLYQPLPSRERVSTQAAVESIVGPLAGGVAGLALLFLTRVAGFSVLHLVAALVGILLLWTVVAVLLRGAYTRALLHALSRRKMVGMGALVPDAETVKIVAARLTSPYPSEVSYALDLLERMGDADTLLAQLGPLLEHPSPEVRADAAARIERRRMRPLVPALRARAEREEDPAVQSRLTRALASLGEGDAEEWLEHYRRATDSRVREGVLIGMLLSGMEGVSERAAAVLESLVGSASEDERALAVRVLGATERRDLAPLLRPALEDPSDDVREEAVMAAAWLGAPELWPSLLGNLAVPALRGRTTAALVAAGPSVLAEVERRLEDPRTHEEVRVRLVRVCGRIGGPDAVRLLWRMVHHGAPPVREAALAALVSAGFQAGGESAAFFGEMLGRELEEAAWVLSTLENLGAAPAALRGGDRLLARELERSAVRPAEAGPEEVLVEALESDFDRIRNRVLQILSILYPARSVARIRANLDSESPTNRAYAMELLENLLPHDWRAPVNEVLGDVTPGEGRPELERLYPQPQLDLPRTLRHILSRPGTQAGSWLNACALYVARERRLTELAEFAASRIASPSSLVRETAAWALASLSPARFEEQRRLPYGDPRPAARRLLRELETGEAGAAGLPIIEKALVLGKVSIFEETPRDLLADIARLLVGHRVVEGEVVIRKGEPGDSMYLLVSGGVRVHDGDVTLDQLREGAIFGELALLDPQPRSATVTATEASELFSLGADPFHELIGGRIEVVQGLFRVLCRRLRHATETALAGLPEPVVEAPGRAGGRGAGAAIAESTSTLERVLVLKSAPIFAETPEHVLAEIATFLVERRYRAGTPILRKGELGTSMYLVVEGEARVHDGEHHLARVGARSIFGELALLDPQPRSASVTAITDLHLFIVEQGPFYELLGERPEVVRGLFRVLARHIRRTSRTPSAVASPSEEGGPSDAAAVTTTR